MGKRGREMERSRGRCIPINYFDKVPALEEKEEKN